MDRLIINPLLRVGGDHVGGPVGDRTSLLYDLLVLQDAADRAGIRLTVDDEFDHLRHDTASIRQPAFRSLPCPNSAGEREYLPLRARPRTSES
jgi:hypothetical protein